MSLPVILSFLQLVSNGREDTRDLGKGNSPLETPSNHIPVPPLRLRLAVPRSTFTACVPGLMALAKGLEEGAIRQGTAFIPGQGTCLTGREP